MNYYKYYQKNKNKLRAIKSPRPTSRCGDESKRTPEMKELKRLRLHEKELQFDILGSDRTGQEKIKTLKSRLNGTGLFREVYEGYNKLLNEQSIG